MLTSCCWQVGNIATYWTVGICAEMFSIHILCLERMKISVNFKIVIPCLEKSVYTFHAYKSHGIIYKIFNFVGSGNPGFCIDSSCSWMCLFCCIGTVCDFRLSYGRVLNRRSKIIAVNRDRSQLLKNSDMFWKPTVAIQGEQLHCTFT